MVKKQGIVYATSTLRAIYIAAATFDEGVRRPDVMDYPPILTPRVMQPREHTRKKLLQSLKDSCGCIKFKDIPDNLTNKCLSDLVFSFKLSNSYNTFCKRPGLYKVQKACSKNDRECVVVAETNGLLVCCGCHYMNLYGSPCPHILSVSKQFQRDANTLPFHTRCLRKGKGVGLKELFTNLKITEELAEKRQKPPTDDFLGIHEVVSEEHHNCVDSAAEEPCDEDIPSKYIHYGKRSEVTKNLQQEIWIAPARSSWVDTNLEQAMKKGKHAVAARRELLEKELIPSVKKTVYDVNDFSNMWVAFTEAKDRYKGQYEQIAASGKRKRSSLITI